MSTWWIVWPDGRERDPNELPPRPLGSNSPTGGPFTPYYDELEHRHVDGSFHVRADTKEEALKKAIKGLTTLPLKTASGRLPAQNPIEPKKTDRWRK